MKLFNESGQPAELFRGDIMPGTVHASLLTRIRCRLSPDSTLSLATGEDQLLDLRRDRVEDEYGIIEPDLPYPRVATDLIILADARSYNGPTIASQVALQAGPYQQELLVIGDRVWERGFAGLQASAPEPFVDMPLTWSRAFGGKAKTAWGEVPNASNPLGKGYCLTEDGALGQPLPNIEDPQVPIQAWNHQPDPVGFGPYPSEWHLRQRECVELRPGDNQLLVHPERGLFDRAHPRLSGQPLVPGDAVIVVGTSFAPRVAFAVPRCPLEMEVRIGSKSWVREPELEELLLDLRSGIVEFTYRKLFKYPFVPRQRRELTLRLRASS